MNLHNQHITKATNLCACGLAKGIKLGNSFYPYVGPGCRFTCTTSPKERYTLYDFGGTDSMWTWDCYN